MQRQTEKTPANLKYQIYQDLKDKLIHCVYPPGAILNELILTEEYHVSRTPVREAIAQLELEKYVKILPKKGIYISDVTVDDVHHIFQTRVEIEPVILKMSSPYLEIEKLLEFRRRFEHQPEDLAEALELDMDMHLYFIDQCRNYYLISMMHRLFDDNIRMLIFTGQNRQKLHNACDEHIAILNSLISLQDMNISAELMRQHVLTCRENALRHFGKQL